MSFDLTAVFGLPYESKTNGLTAQQIAESKGSNDLGIRKKSRLSGGNSAMKGDQPASGATKRDGNARATTLTDGP
jgi:hypothetical protein